MKFITTGNRGLKTEKGLLGGGGEGIGVRGRVERGVFTVKKYRNKGQ